MYDDPRDDGYITVENGFEPYPAGPARNPTAVQRGSVAYVNLYRASTVHRAVNVTLQLPHSR